MAVAIEQAEERRSAVEARFEALVLDFLAHLEFERGLARNTLTAYRTDLLQYGTFLAERHRGATDAERARRRRLPRRPGDRQRPPRLLAGDDQPQGRLPAVLLPAPAPRGADRRRPDGGARSAEQEPQAPSRAQLRRGEAAAGERRRRRRDRAARPRPARGDVRVRPAGLGGRGARRQRRRPAARLRAPARQGQQGAHRPARPRGGRGGQAVPAGRSPGAGRPAPELEAVRQLPRRPADPAGPLQDHPAGTRRRWAWRAG